MWIYTYSFFYVMLDKNIFLCLRYHVVWIRWRFNAKPKKKTEKHNSSRRLFSFRYGAITVGEHLVTDLPNNFSTNGFISSVAAPRNVKV